MLRLLLGKRDTTSMFLTLFKSGHPQQTRAALRDGSRDLDGLGRSVGGLDNVWTCNSNVKHTQKHMYTHISLSILVRTFIEIIATLTLKLCRIPY